jgi:ABC-type branched-subunit amino acid transport system substrate-binding protein/predicted negative regulator of RcsB-dependent stress response
MSRHGFPTRQARPSPSRKSVAGLCAVLLALLGVPLPDGLPLAQPSLARAQQTDAAPQPLPKDPLARAKALIDAQKEDDAIAALKSVMATSSPPQLAHAYLLMGAALIGKKNYPDAVSHLERLLTEFPDSEYADRARVLLGTAHMQAGNLDAALSALSPARQQDLDLDTKRQALHLIGEVQAYKKDYSRAVQAWLEELGLSPEPQQAEVRDRLRTLVQDRMDRKALLQLRDAYPATFPGDMALMRLIEYHTNRGEEHLAERNLRLFVERFPDHEYAQTAAEQLRTFKSKVKASQYVIAVALPTSGRLGSFGLEALNGIRLALEKGKETLGLASVGLVVKDTGGLEKGVLRAELSDLIGEYRPLAVVGPLLSRELQAAAALAEESETPFITPAATLPDVHRLSPYLFSTALTYQQQAKRLADYAMDRLGYRRFCTLYPDSPYGQELARFFGQEVRQRGGEMIAAESYAESDTDFAPQIKRLKAEDLKHYGTAETTQTSKGATKINYTPGFDAIFLPGSYSQIAMLAPQLLFYDVKVPLLGSNAWNSPELLRLAERTVEGGVFVSGLFPDSPDPGTREFVERYRRRFQANPTLFAAQAYDATRLVLEAIKRGASSGKAVREHLTKLTDLPTLSGPAAFTPGGTLDRHVVLVQVKNGRFVQLD